MTTGYPVPPKDFADERRHRQMLADCISGVMQGRMNNTGVITFAASSATTVMTDSKLSVNSVVILMPTTANAASANNSWYITGIGNGSATIHHSNNSQTDRTFLYIVMG